ncbi:MAG: sugar MFS transporter [Phormidesmis sp. FL-bin-119]|nr:sugar MFS transporter [Pedobacter sp.]
MPNTTQKPDSKPIQIIGALFFVFGFVTWLGSVLIPYLKIACKLNNFEAYMVAFSFYISYLIAAVPAAWLLKKTGFKRGISYGLLIMAAGTLIFIPAAMSREYVIFLLGLFVQGAGMAILQTASNPYVTILGPPESAAKRISIMGICNGIAGIIAPLILGSVILENTDEIQNRLITLSLADQAYELDALASRVIIPYLVMAGILSILSFFALYSSLPEIDTDHEDQKIAAANINKSSIFQFPHLILGVVTLFLYVGVEVIAGDTIIGYGASQQIPLSSAKYFTSATLSAMLIGYLIGIACIPRYFSQEAALKVSAALGIVFVLAAIFTSGYVSVTFIALLGLSNSLMWPAIWPLAIADLGRFTKIGSSMLIMAIGGGALIPLLYGHLADIFNPRDAYWIVVPCYLMIGHYALYGHKVRKV